MKLSYDPKYNIAYIRLREPGAQVETVKLSDELNVDISSDGKVYGFELLNANEQLAGGGASGATGVPGLTIVNEASGESSQVPLPL